jgi:hypothetical protein
VVFNATSRNHDKFAFSRNQSNQDVLDIIKENIRNHLFVATSVVLILLFFPLRSISQFEHKLFTSNMMVETRFNYGFIYPHHLELEIFNSHFPAFEISLQKETYGKHKWERAYAYPLIGISFWYSGLGQSPYLGSALALFPYIDFPLYRNKLFFLGFRFALGLGYLTKKFDRINNYKNLAIGGHFNAAVNLMVDFRYKLSNRFTISGGISLQHFSNGSLKLPNYGLNYPSVSLGVAYRLVRENKNIGDRFYPPVEPFSAIIRRSIEFNVGGAVGYKNMESIYGENYIVTHFYENTFFRVSRKSKFGFGFDVSYDPSQIKTLEMNGVEVTNKIDIVRPGINAAYQLDLSKLGFILNLGYYLAGKEKSNGPLYEKISFQYSLTKSLFVNVMLKVHWGRADYIGWGLGYRFEKFYGKKTVK